MPLGWKRRVSQARPWSQVGAGAGGWGAGGETGTAGESGMVSLGAAMCATLSTVIILLSPRIKGGLDLSTTTRLQGYSAGRADRAVRNGVVAGSNPAGPPSFSMRCVVRSGDRAVSAVLLHASEAPCGAVSG